MIPTMTNDQQNTHIVQKLQPSAKLPTRNYPDDIGLDVYSDEWVKIPANSVVIVKTGIAIKPADGTWLQCESRSGLAGNHGVSVLGGIVDHKYRGEVKIILANHTGSAYEVNRGDKIAQLVERPIMIHAVEEGNLDDTERGGSGFGSSGR